jgi:hypothetical protein
MELRPSHALDLTLSLQSNSVFFTSISQHEQMPSVYHELDLYGFSFSATRLKHNASWPDVTKVTSLTFLFSLSLSVHHHAPPARQYGLALAYLRLAMARKVSSPAPAPFLLITACSAFDSTAPKL